MAERRQGPGTTARPLVTVLALALFALAPGAAEASEGADACGLWEDVSSAPEREGFYLPAPDPDPFYAQPDPMPSADNLNANGVAATRAMRDGCFGGTTDGSLPRFGRFADYTRSDPFARPETQAVISQTSLPQAGLTPSAATYLYHAVGDEVQPVRGVDALVREWCDRGVAVAYHRMPVGDHLSSALIAIPDVIRFLHSAFDGSDFSPLPTTQTCN